jgi:hypothetical protein
MMGLNPFINTVLPRINSAISLDPPSAEFLAIGKLKKYCIVISFKKQRPPFPHS